MLRILTLFIISLLVWSILGNFVAYGSRSGTNWLLICRNPIVDPLIAEPCESLTTDGGYQLTEKGKRVLVCLLLGGVGKILRYSDEELRQYAPLAGCGGPGQDDLAPQPVQPPSEPAPEPTQPLDEGERAETEQISDKITAHVDGINGHKIIITADVVETGAHLERSVEGGYDSYYADFNFYTGFAPLGSTVNICVNNLYNYKQNCESVIHNTNPQDVYVQSPQALTPVEEQGFGNITGNVSGDPVTIGNEDISQNATNLNDLSNTVLENGVQPPVPEPKQPPNEEQGVPPLPPEIGLEKSATIYNMT